MNIVYLSDDEIEERDTQAKLPRACWQQSCSVVLNSPDREVTHFTSTPFKPRKTHIKKTKVEKIRTRQSPSKQMLELVNESLALMERFK